MKTLEELTDANNPAIDLIRGWVGSADSPCELLPPSSEREAVLLDVQVSTQSVLGALSFETGGLLVDHGWLRFLGSGHPKLTRTLSDWNRDRSEGFYLIADDAVGGFYALNGGAFGENTGDVCYWAPDHLKWEPIGFSFSDFLEWSMSSCLSDFYQNLRWKSWKEDIAELTADRCFFFSPFLWTKEGSIRKSERKTVPVHEAYGLKCDIVEQLSG